MSVRLSVRPSVRPSGCYLIYRERQMQYRNVIHGSKRIRCEKVLKQKWNLYDHPFERYGPKTGHDWRKNTTKKRLIFKLFDVA